MGVCVLGSDREKHGQELKKKKMTELVFLEKIGPFCASEAPAVHHMEGKC